MAEVLITIGVVGIVAAMTLPTLIQNIQERQRKEQVRTVKYKLTQATDKMKSLSLIGPYSTTEEFVTELKKHLKIAKVCDSSDLRSCWPTESIVTPDGNVSINSISNGSKLKALALGTSATKTVGIVTADGTPMILAYSPVCNALAPEKTYLWSTVDNKPETNATTNCISAIFDINGSKKPNKIGTDVRTLNSLFGSKQYSATSITKAECNRLKGKLGINGCYYDNDYWAGAVKKCHDIGMHLPSMQTLANIAGAKYGRTDIAVGTYILRNDYGGEISCYDWFHKNMQWVDDSQIICVDMLPNGANSSVASIAGHFWSSSELSASQAQTRNLYSIHSLWYSTSRNYDNGFVSLCVGD